MTSEGGDEDPSQHILNILSDGHIRVAVVGNVDAGKSTLIGTLCHCKLDDGNGSNRLLVSKVRCPPSGTNETN